MAAAWLRPGRSLDGRLAVAAAVAIALALGWTATRSTVWDRDEARFAQATVEMVRSGEWLVPTFNGALRADKPILIYWLMSPWVALLGPTPLALRLTSVLGCAAALLLTWAIGRELFDAHAALIALGALATTPLAAAIGVVATTDAVLLCCVCLAAAALARALGRGLDWRGTILVGLAVALALLVKGPIGIAVPALTAVGTAWLGRREPMLSRRDAVRLTIAALLAIGVFVAWGLPANLATGGELARRGLGHHVLERMARPLEGHGGSLLLYLPYYLVDVAVLFFPWTLHLPGALSAVFGGRVGGSRGRALLLGWIVPTLAMLTAVATKLPHYAVVVWPALALAVGGTVAAAGEGRLAERDLRWLRRGVWFHAPVAALVVFACVAGPRLLHLTALAPGCLLAGLVLAATSAGAIVEQWRGRFARSTVVLVAGTMLLGLVLAAEVIPAFEAYKPSAPLAAAIRARVPDSVSVAVYRYQEPSLVFYLQRPRVEILHDEASVEAWSRSQGAAVLVLPREALGELGPSAASLAILATARGFDYVKARWVDLVAVERPPLSRR